MGNGCSGGSAKVAELEKEIEDLHKKNADLENEQGIECIFVDSKDHPKYEYLMSILPQSLANVHLGLQSAASYAMKDHMFGPEPVPWVMRDDKGGILDVGHPLCVVEKSKGDDKPAIVKRIFIVDDSIRGEMIDKKFEKEIEAAAVIFEEQLNAAGLLEAEEGI
jgi:hypothetical protein